MVTLSGLEKSAPDPPGLTARRRCAAAAEVSSQPATLATSTRARTVRIRRIELHGIARCASARRCHHPCNLLDSRLGVGLAELDQALQKLRNEHEQAHEVGVRSFSRAECAGDEAERARQPRLVLRREPADILRRADHGKIDDAISVALLRWKFAKK